VLGHRENILSRKDSRTYLRAHGEDRSMQFGERCSHNGIISDRLTTQSGREGGTQELFQ